jgi:acetolactate synthase-1/2/3 large subunit
MDSIPVVAITGQVSSELIGRDSFQEVDTTGATSPFTKHNYLVKDAASLPRILKEAFYIASTGRPGPVLIDIPYDIQTAEIDFVYPETVNLPGYNQGITDISDAISKVGEALESSHSPVICAGGGIISSRGWDALLSFSEKLSIPVTNTLMGIGSLPTSYELNFGMIGSHGVYTANYAIHNADLVFIIGARVGNRAMGTASEIAKKAKIVHIDIDPAEIDKNIKTDINIIADAKYVLEELSKLTPSKNYSAWVEKLKILKQKHMKELIFPENSNTINPPFLLSKLSELTDSKAIITTEVGQNQIWAANYYRVKSPSTFISSGGMGTMGYGLPASVGAKMGCPKSPVIAISGDGSLQMSIQEFGTIKQENIGVKVVLFNNSRLGMVREMQKVKFSGRYSQVYMEHNPDFQMLARAYGFRSEKISSNSEIGAALKRMLSDDSSYLLECIVDSDEPTLYQHLK